MSRLQKLRERRAYECRLTPDRALRSLDEAAAFLRDRGLLTRTADSALPSLYEACHEDPYAPGRGGFGEWPATKWPWFGELADRDDIHPLKVHGRGKSLLVTAEIAALLDPICRAEVERMRRDSPEWGRVLNHLAAAGPSEPEDLKVELDLKPKELKGILFPLELCGAVLRRNGMVERWDQAFPEPPDGAGGPDELLVAAVRAAVVAPEREVGRWFAWRRLFPPELVEGLVAAGRLERPEPGWVAATRAGTDSARARG
jgi:hypothetical protein